MNNFEEAFIRIMSLVIIIVIVTPVIVIGLIRLVEGAEKFI